MSSQAIQMVEMMNHHPEDGMDMLPMNRIMFDDTGAFPDPSRPRQPGTLEQRIRQIRFKQYQLNCHLKRSLKVNMDRAREILKELVSVSLSEPRTRILSRKAVAIRKFVDEYLDNPRVVSYLTRVSVHDDATQMHLINVMLYVMGFAFQEQMGRDMIRGYGLAGLLHDVGKVFVPEYVLRTTRDLTDGEYLRIRKHPAVGFKMLEPCEFGSEVLLAARDHHERLDGSGYPRGKTGDSLSDIAKLIAIADIFEALTTWRPYRDAMKPLGALEQIKTEVVAGRLDGDIFQRFAKSVVGMASQVVETTLH